MEQIPPFYAGQEVEAVKTAEPLILKGGKYIVHDCYNKCGHGFTVEIEGAMSPINYPLHCNVCGSKQPIKAGKFFKFNPDCFRAITPQYEAISFSKILEEQFSSVN